MQRFPLFAGILLSVSLVKDRDLSANIAAVVLQDAVRGENVDTSRADASITHATVYFGYGAELTHESKVKVNADTKIIVISQLSTAIDINSLQISCPENVALLSQRYQLYYPPAPPVVKSKEVTRLEDSIALLQKDIERIENQVSIEQDLLTKTGSLIETTINTSGNKTVNSDEVLKLVEYYNARIEKSKTSIFQFRQSQRKLNEQVTAMHDRIAKLSDVEVETPRPYGQIILQVLCKHAEEVPVSLSYYTRNAGWTPVYDVRVNSKTNQVKLVYKASLTQTSGIDWKKAKLTLSTGTPNFGITAPILSPWYLQLYVPALYNSLQGRAAGLSVQNTIQSMSDNKKLAEEVVVNQEGYGVQRKKDMAYSTQSIDPSNLQQFTTLNEGQLNTNFDIDLPYDVESDGQMHSVSIKDELIDCNLKNYAVPRMDKEAYLLAEVADWQNLDLLPGEANIIMDDTYLGKSLIDPNSTADTLNLPLGKDKRLAIKRELVKELSSLKTTSKDSRQVFTWELTVKNNKLTDVNMLLKDQYPLSTIKEVEVKLEEDGKASVNEETGVLTWKVALKPGESKKFRFSYSVKYPKDKKLVK